MERTVLGCFRQHKRPVTFMEDGDRKDRSIFIAAFRNAYCDVLDQAEVEADTVLTVQVKNEQWGGEFVDMGDDEKIPDRAVLRVVVEVQVCSCVSDYCYCVLFGYGAYNY